MKGPRPTDEDQKLWAPLLYFTHAVAGNMVAMMHKLGMFKLRIGYGVKKVSDMLYNYETTYLACIIEDGALVEALKKGRPGFAAVDVFEDEPVLGAAHPLLKMKNALCTPHLGYNEKSSYEAVYAGGVEQILAYAAGNPVNVLNPEVLAKK